MMCMSSDEILARRREQNRLAQRRFREGKQSQRKGPKSSQCRKRVDSAQRSLESYQSSSSSPEPSPDDGMIDLLLENFQASELSTGVTPEFWSHHIESESLSGVMFPCFDSIDKSTSAEVLSLLSPCPKLSHVSSNDVGYFGTQNFTRQHIPQSPALDLTVLSSAMPELPQSLQRHIPQRTHSQNQYTQDFQHDSGSFRQAQSLSPLHIAARDGHVNIVQALIDHGAECNQPDGHGLTALDHAIIQGHDEIVMKLLLHKTNAEMQTALHRAVCHRRETALTMILSHSRQAIDVIDETDSLGRAPLHVAVNIGFEAGVRILLQFGADPNCMT